jgi:hypothetical protein
VRGWSRLSRRMSTNGSRGALVSHRTLVALDVVGARPLASPRRREASIPGAASGVVN